MKNGGKENIEGNSIGKSIFGGFDGRSNDRDDGVAFPF